MPSPDAQNMGLAYEPGPRPHPYNVLIVVCDDLAARHLDTFGYDRETMPRLSKRVESGTLFKSCESPVGWTLPACASIITGQLPDDHGLFDHNRKFQLPKIGHYLGPDYERYAITNNGNVVADSISTEYLESLGFKRRPAKWRFFGWSEGFDRHDWVHREDHRTPFERARIFLSDRRSQDEQESTAETDKPYFLFFHSNLVHDYHMDRPHYCDVSAWTDEEIHPGLRGVKDGPEIWRDPPEGVTWDLESRQMIAKYDSGIREYDERLDEVLELVDFDRTIVVFMSDHGEGFEPERGRVHHCGRLHEDLTHVPLAIWLPPELRARYEPPKVETRFCSTIDVVPTVLTLLGDAVAGFPGRFLFDLPAHRRLTGVDRGYVYWNDDCIRESYDTCQIEIRSETVYPLKRITVRKNDTVREYAYNLAYDPRERDNLLEPSPEKIPGFEPITFIVAVNDMEETRNNFLVSPVAASPHHQFFVVDNTDNQKFDSISRLYAETYHEAEHDLVLFVHQDVFLPHGWEARFFAALRELEEIDPSWGVIGPVGARPVNPGKPKELRGHWCDPSGYHCVGPLPHEVESLDEQLLGVRKSAGIKFDAELPGFHCYGIDLSLAAREVGRKTYAIDCFAWHKFKDSNGYLVERRERSEKITRRWGEEFMGEFVPGAEYVERKWKKYLPFQTTSWTWGVD